MTREEKAGIEILGIEHIGLAPKDPAKAEWFFGKLLGLPEEGRETVKAQSVQTIIFVPKNNQKAKGPTGKGKLEILKDCGEPGTISGFIEKKGGGIHHVALQVANVEAAIEYLVSNGVELISKHPGEGVQNTKVAFVHPRSTGGILVELVECFDT